VKAKGPLGVINVNLSYWIRNPEGDVVSLKRTMVGVETIRKDIYYLILPIDSEIGTYTFEVLAQYDNATDTASATFEVVSRLAPPSINVRKLEIPLLMAEEKSSIRVVIGNTEENPLNVTATLFLPEGFEPRNVTIEKVIGAHSEEIFEFNFKPKTFGSFTGFLEIRYGEKKTIKDFPLNVYSPVITYGPILSLIIKYWWIGEIVIIVILVVFVYKTFSKFRKKERIVYVYKK
jgi:hypothetical protein